MSSDAEFSSRLEQAKLDAMKELAYGASHEINNPLANISARAQALLRDERAPERRRALEAIQHQALRAHEMISDLMLFARPPRPAFAEVDVAAVVHAVVGEIGAEASRREIEVAELIDDAVPLVTADETQLAVAIRALCDNAMQAIGHGGRIAIDVTPLSADGESGGGVAIEVHDDGPGVPPEIRPRIFDPFFSGREAGRGLGFGLSKAWRIVTDHGGQLRVVDATAGAVFRIELPLAAVQS